LYLVAVFDVSAAVAIAIAVAVLVTAIFAGVASKTIDHVWSYWSCCGVLIRFKGVDEIHLVEF
jgi:hypothetical protein